LQAEKEILGLNHPQIARRLLKKWNLPGELTNIIVYHHNPVHAPSPEKAGIVHLADILAHGLGIGSSGERSVPYFDYSILEKIVNPIDSIKMVVRQILHQFGPMDAIFSSWQSE
jgi:HD-like signal output (HDOD) protein